MDPERRKKILEWLPKNVTMPKYMAVTNQRFNALYLGLCILTLAFICWDFFGHEGWSSLTYIRTELFVELVPEASVREEASVNENGDPGTANATGENDGGDLPCVDSDTNCRFYAMDGSLCFSAEDDLPDCCGCGRGTNPNMTQSFGTVWGFESPCSQSACKWTEASQDQQPCAATSSLSPNASDPRHCDATPPQGDQLLEFDSKKVFVVTAQQTWSWYDDSFTTHRRDYTDITAVFRFAHRSTSIEGTFNTVERLLGDEHERISTTADAITILLEPTGLVWKVFDKHKDVDVSVPDLVFAATGSDTLPPDGAEIVVQVGCYSDTTDLIKSPLLAPEGYNKVGYEAGAERLVCLMRATLAKRFAQARAYKTPGQPEVTKQIGLMVRTTDSMAAARYLHSDGVFGKLVALSILLLLPTILLQFLIYFCLGQLSVVFKDVVLSQFDLSQEISALAVKLIVDWVMFNILAERKRSCPSAISRKRLRDNMQFIFHQMEFQMPETQAANVNQLVKDFSNFVFDHTSEAVHLDREPKLSTATHTTTRGSSVGNGNTIPSMLRSTIVSVQSGPEEPSPDGKADSTANPDPTASAGVAGRQTEATEQGEARPTRTSATVKHTINFEAFAKTTCSSNCLDMDVLSDVFETGRRPGFLESLFTPAGMWTRFQSATRRAQRTLNPVVWQDGQIMARTGRGEDGSADGEGTPAVAQKEATNREARGELKKAAPSFRNDMTELAEVQGLHKDRVEHMDRLEAKAAQIMDSIERLREEFLEDKQWCAAAVEVVIEAQEKDSIGHARAEFARTKAEEAHKCAGEADWLASQSREATTRALWESDHKIASLEEQLDKLLASE